MESSLSIKHGLAEAEILGEVPRHSAKYKNDVHKQTKNKN